MSKKIQQAQELLISDLETVKVISDPLRIQILETMTDKPVTVKQVAKIVGVAASKLYYHIGLLEKHGLIVVADTQIVSGIVEKWYQAAAFSFRVDRRLFKPGVSGDSAFDLINVVFESTIADIRRAIDKGIIRLEDDASPSERLMMSRSRTLLTPEQASDVYARLTELLKEFSKHEEGEPAEGKRAYALMLALYPYDASAMIAKDEETSNDD